MATALDTTNISPRQGRLRQVVGWILTVAGVAVGLWLASDDAGILPRLVPVAGIMWGTSWILGGRAQLCAVDATRGREHPTELLSVGLGGQPVEDPARDAAIRRAARSATVRATVLGIALSLPVLVL